MRRRVFNAFAVGALTMGAGCGESNSQRPTSMSCEQPIESALGQTEVIGTDYESLALQEPVVQDNWLSFELVNTSESGSRRTESEELYDIQEANEGNWTSIFCVSPEKEWNRDITWHDPGAGFTWEFDMADGKISDPRTDIHVDKDISQGKYRFVYFGLVEPKLESTKNAPHKAISAQFSIN